MNVSCVSRSGAFPILRGERRRHTPRTSDRGRFRVFARSLLSVTLAGMPSAEQAALWSAIRTNPEDDTPRLVYADWLQENGDEERAEFIRVQCELAKLPWQQKETWRERGRLMARSEQLLAPNR